MSPADQVHPAADEWVAAVHAGERDLQPLGSAVVVDSRRVLTCAHVLLSDDGRVMDGLWVSFPKAADAAGDERRRVKSAVVAHEAPAQDLAMLILDQDVPTGVTPAPLRCPRPADVADRKWWAFGFPDRDLLGDSADGIVGASLAFGWVRLDTTSKYLVRPGFSGGGLWSPDYQAVIGMVGQAHANGDGRAITLRQADLLLPGQQLRLLAGWAPQAAGEVALAAWGWSLDRDPEGVRHWRPRARGVSVDSERGYRFRGRTQALTQITQWLDNPAPARRVLVVTGSPGAGKSAVLGRVVTTADAGTRAMLPGDDAGVRAAPGSVACAVHAKSKTALEVATEMARAASAALPAEPGDLAPAIRDTLEARSGQAFGVIIDALDEAASPAQARLIIEKIVLPLAETCASAGARVVIGTRRHDGGGSLLDPFAGALAVIDLDEPEYSAGEDLASYALACLQLAGDERPASPYAEDAAARPVAARIAALSDRNFLVAGLVARGHGLHDERAADPAQLTFDATVDSALAAYLKRTGSVAGVPASRALTGLAFAEAPGLPAPLWQLAIEALEGCAVPAGELARFGRSTAANFLIESGADQSSQPIFRLFHQALNDALARARLHLASRRDDERTLTTALASYGRRCGWASAPGYLLRSLPGHAAAGGLIDDLLADDDYLLHADLRRLLLTAPHAASQSARRRIQLLGLTPQAIPVSSEERAALFSLTQAMENMAATYRDHPSAPYTARWARAYPRGARAVLEAHQGRIYGVCPITVNGQDLLASSSDDRTIRIWDPSTGRQTGILEGHEGYVYDVCSITVNGRDLLASASSDRTIRTWDPATGQQTGVLEGHQGWANGVCSITVNGQDLLASASDDATIRIWDPAIGQQISMLDAHRGPVYSVCATTVNGRDLLASSSQDASVRIWDLSTGQQASILEGHKGEVYSVCPITVNGQDLLASVGSDRTVRIWDPATSQQTRVLEGHRGAVNGVCPITMDGQDLLASASDDRTIRTWDPATGQQTGVLEGHQGWANGVCSVTVNGQDLLASVSSDRTVRIWDPATGRQRAFFEGHRSRVNGMCLVTASGQDLLASASEDTIVRIWDPATGQQTGMLEGHRGEVYGTCLVTVNSQEFLASGGQDATVRIWDPSTGRQTGILEGHENWVNGVCPITVNGQNLLASASRDATVRIWDPVTGRQTGILKGHEGGVRGVCPITVNGQDLLASASSDRTVRIWNPATGQQTAILQGHRGGVNSVCPITLNGQDLLASSSQDGTVRIWDPAASTQANVLEGHQDGVNGVCPIIVNGRDLLASASSDRTVRIWEPTLAACLVTVPAYYPVLAIAAKRGSLAIGLSAGILLIDIRLPG